MFLFTWVLSFLTENDGSPSSQLQVQEQEHWALQPVESLPPLIRNCSSVESSRRLVNLKVPIKFSFRFFTFWHPLQHSEHQM